MAIDFVTAAKAASLSADEDTVDVPIEGITYKAHRLTTIQAGLLADVLRRGNIRLPALLGLIEAMMGIAAREHIERLIFQGRIEGGDLLGGGTVNNPESGLLDKIVEEFSSRPTVPSTDSSESQESTGRSSTENSPAETSIPSPYPSTAS